MRAIHHEGLKTVKIRRKKRKKEEQVDDGTTRHAIKDDGSTLGKTEKEGEYSPALAPADTRITFYKPPFLSRRKLHISRSTRTSIPLLDVVGVDCYCYELIIMSAEQEPPSPVVFLSEIDHLRNKKSVFVDCNDLSFSAFIAVSRFNVPIILDKSIEAKRTHINAVSEMESWSHHLETSPSYSNELPWDDAVPEDWIRGALLLGIRSLASQKSEIGIQLALKMKELLDAKIIPAIPLPGDISKARGISPWSYIADSLDGSTSVSVYDNSSGVPKTTRSLIALDSHGISPLHDIDREHLELLSRIPFGASVASLALYDMIYLALLVLTLLTMEREVQTRTRLSFDLSKDLLTELCPDQAECVDILANVVQGITLIATEGINGDCGEIQNKDNIFSATKEYVLDSGTDGKTEKNSREESIRDVTGYHSLMLLRDVVSWSLRLEKLILQGLDSVDSVVESIVAELPNLDLDNATQGIDDRNIFKYFQPQETDIKKINSRTLVFGSYIREINAVLSRLISELFYRRCQDVDVRALRIDFLKGVEYILTKNSFEPDLDRSRLQKDLLTVFQAMDLSVNYGVADAFASAAESFKSIALNAEQKDFGLHAASDSGAIEPIYAADLCVASQVTELLGRLRQDYISNVGLAGKYLEETRLVYEFVRFTLQIKPIMSRDHPTPREEINVIYKAIKGGMMQSMIVKTFGVKKSFMDHFWACVIFVIDHLCTMPCIFVRSDHNKDI